MIEITKKELCSGCTACVCACPQKCIHMEADSEGFLYPSINIEQCINCNVCEKVCPILNPVIEKEVSQKAYLVQHRDEEIRLDSTAGGAFTAIASYVIDMQGVVYGAAYNEDFQVYHTYVERKEDLGKFRNSKYVQSYLGDSFIEVRNFLNEDRWVCFSGTPCQIEGLSKFLRKEYDKLILVDVVCHGVPSPLIWSKYLEFQNVKDRQIDNIRFRDKYYGYKYSTMSFRQDGNNIYHAGSQLDPMLRSFFSDICDRPACYDCSFKKRYRVSDLTIWDCFSVYDFDKEMDDDKGTTRVLCHSKKGKKLIEDLRDVAKCREVCPERLVNGVREMFESVEANPKRNEFMRDAQVLTGRELFYKYYPITIKVKLKTVLRKILVLSGIYGKTKMLLNKLRGR